MTTNGPISHKLVSIIIVTLIVWVTMISQNWFSRINHLLDSFKLKRFTSKEMKISYLCFFRGPFVFNTIITRKISEISISIWILFLFNWNLIQGACNIIQYLHFNGTEFPQNQFYIFISWSSRAVHSNTELKFLVLMFFHE